MTSKMHNHRYQQRPPWLKMIIGGVWGGIVGASMLWLGYYVDTWQYWAALAVAITLFEIIWYYFND